MPRVPRPLRSTAAAPLDDNATTARSPLLCSCGCDTQARPNVDSIVIDDGRVYLSGHVRGREWYPGSRELGQA